MSAISPEVAEAQTRAGLPAEALYQRKLVYCDAGNLLIYSFSVAHSGLSLGRVFVRQLPGTRYEPVMRLGENVSMESSIVCERPILFALLFEVSREVDIGQSNRFKAIVRIDLTNGRVEEWDTERMEVEPFFAVETCAASASGDVLTVVGGYRTHREECIECSYHVVSLDWTSRTSRRLVELRDVFF